MSRSVIGLHWVRTGPRADLNDPRRMDVLKTNLCRYPAGIGVTLQPMEEDPQVAEILYGPIPRAYQQPTKQDACAGWLLEALEVHGTLTPAEVVAMGAKAGFSRATLYRARRQLGPQVVVTHGKCRAEDQWALAEDPEEGDHGSESRKDGDDA
jgi:hypothetical protein